jgi:hypothetical protein
MKFKPDDQQLAITSIRLPVTRTSQMLPEIAELIQSVHMIYTFSV